MDITVVTITNRKRWHLLQKTLESAFADGADRAVVVDNESSDNIGANMSACFPGRHLTVRLDKNQGPAGAYYEGLKAALASGAEFLLLLDDDNAVKPGTIASLTSVYTSKLETCGLNGLCVAGLRREQEMIRGAVPDSQRPSGARFLNFHIKEIPARIWKRRPRARQKLRERAALVSDEPVKRAVAPWGGLFFHRSVIDRFGYPDPRFVLYCDDVEFTDRVTSGGGAIWMVPTAEIEDLESSWLSGEKKMTYPAACIKRGSDEQVYYQIRNRSYLETHVRKSSFMRTVNRAVFISILWFIAVRSAKQDRFRMILKAAKDGERGQLGFCGSEIRS